MDCNMRSPLHWDWENLIMFNPSETESHKKSLSADWVIEKGEGIESVVPCFSGFEGVSSGSGTNFWQTALSKSSQSTSITSSSPEVKTCKFVSESIPEDSCSNIEFEQVKASPAVEVSVASAESFLGLKLGKRTYFEEFCGGNNNNISAVSMKLTPSVAIKKSKSCGQSIQVPRCQVEGCDLDLSSAKDYHRKHRVCESHSKCPKVVVGGLERRFCQQCSRFHALAEFDEKKRSCRKRLSHHNARRRKPQGVFPLNPARMYDRRQPTNLLWNELSLNTEPEGRYSWGVKAGQAESGFTLSFRRGNGTEKEEEEEEEEQLFSSCNRQPFLRSFSMFQNATAFSAGKSGFHLSGKGVEDFSVNLGVKEGHHQHQHHQDFHNRALSLLSTTSSNSHETLKQQHTPTGRLQATFADPPPLPPPQQPISDAFPTLFI